MHQDFDSGRSVYLDRDDDGSVRALRHLDEPVPSQARTPQLVAMEYLHSYADLLAVPAEGMARLSESCANHPEPAGVELRYHCEKTQFDTATVAYHQTVLGLPVWEAGVAVQMSTSPYRVLCAQSTQHTDVRVKTPREAALRRAESLTTAQLAKALGLPARDGGVQPSSKALEIEGRELVVYRYESDKVQRDGPPSVIVRDVDGPRGGNGRARRADVEVVERPGDINEASMPWLPLPLIPDNIAEGEHRVGLRVDFALPVTSWGTLHWTAILDVETSSVLYLRPHVDDVTGLVFEVDPVTTNGGPLPSGTNAALNPIRVARPLLGLTAPSGGSQSLAGDTVALVDSELPTIAGPTAPSGTNFDFDARTNNFSAVNAYVHCDRFFRLVDGMGFSRSGYFGGTSFPSSVDHRGRMNTTDGIEVNAHCVGTPGGAGIARTTFALASTGDTANPIGLADDYRVVLHELGGHGVLYNHVSSANFGFAHSAGDSIAAILNDPGSQAPDRFFTFPWITIIARRHDRLPGAGWGWAGSIALNPFGSSDGGGYNNEQILSSTMFRLYRSLGGDSTNLTTQQFAARMSVYLILRAIATLTQATNPAAAAGFETAMETADSGDWVSENITGGAYRKVIRWAFEKQGMFQPMGTATPNNNVGAPPAVDVYVDDGRAGEYQYQPVFWDNQNVWNRVSADGGVAHQNPVVGRTNYAYVRVRNRGTQVATGIVVKGYHANPATGLSFPNDWVPMTTTGLPGANVPANNGGDVVVGPFSWTPTHVGHECMFMVVSATGDASNASNIAAGSSIPEWRLVPHDNNIGQRNVAPVPGGGTTGLAAEFDGLSFEVKNPLPTVAVMSVEPTLPPVLAERGWDLAFTNRGGGEFKLAAGESRQVVMGLAPGSDFSAADIEAADERSIKVFTRADGILVGGMTYLLDADLEAPHRNDNPAPGLPGHEHDDRCPCRPDARVDDLATDLLRHLDLRHQRVSEVRVRKVILEIGLEDCAD